MQSECRAVRWTLSPRQPVRAEGVEATRSIVVEDVQGTVFLLLPKESTVPHTMTTEAADLDQDLDSDAGVASKQRLFHRY